MEPRTVLLVKSREIGWAAVDAALRPMARVRVIGEATSAARAVDLAATLRPDAILSATMVGGTAMRPLLAGLRRGPCPPPIVVLFGQRPDADDVRVGHDLVVSAHLMWSDLSADTLGHVLAAVLSGEVIVASRPVFKAFVRARPYVAPVPGEGATRTLTARERAVLRGLADGSTRKEIAAATGFGLRTVGRLLDGLEAKLGVASACALVGKAASLGLLTSAVDGAEDNATPTLAPALRETRLGRAPRPSASSTKVTRGQTMPPGATNPSACPAAD